MKTIAVILPINNPDILTQLDLNPYCTPDVMFKLHYVDTTLRELNTAEDVAIVQGLVIKKIHQVTKEGAAAIVIYAFGELGIQETKNLIGIPIMALGTEAILQSSQLSKKKFTILPGMLAHNEFLGVMVKGNGFAHNYSASLSAPEVTPAQIRKDHLIVDKLAVVAEREITDNNVDTFTLGCGSFIGLAKPLETRLQMKFGPSIHVIDPVNATFERVKNAAGL